MIQYEERFEESEPLSIDFNTDLIIENDKNPEKPSAKKSRNVKTGFKCPECQWKGLKMSEHWNLCHENVPKPLKCDKCDYETVLKYYLTKHTKEQHRKQTYVRHGSPKYLSNFLKISIFIVIF